MRAGQISAAVAVALTGVAVLVAHPATGATTGSFTCIQTTSGRKANVQKVTGRIAADGSPDNVLVTRPANPNWVDFGPVADPPRATDVEADWQRNYGLDVYDVSTVPFPPLWSRRGLFGIPHNQSGRTGSTFGALLNTQMTGGGQWFHRFSCTVS